MIRMTAENNRKYIAEAWFENGEEEEFKKSFLKSLIEQWQGPENGFDADTVDGMHGDEIIQAINTSIQDFIKTFQIGNTTFKNDKFHYYLGFEGVKLYNIESDTIEEKLKTLPWSTSPYTQEKDIPDLYDVIYQLYELTYMGEDGSVSNKDLYREFKDILEGTDEEHQGLIRRVNTLESVLTENIFDGGLNASSVNGLRFFIYSKTDYNTMKSIAESYENGTDTSDSAKNEYDKLHSVHNIFIVREDSELPSDYGEMNPDTITFDKGYEFAIFTIDMYDEEQGKDVPTKALHYKYEKASESDWKFLCKVSDFFDEEDLEAKLVKIINETDNYVLNPTSVEIALRHILINDESPMPFVQNYLKDEYIRGGFKGTVPESIENMPTPLNEHTIKLPNGLTYLNLNEIYDDLEDINNNLNDYKTEIEGNVSSQLQTVNDNIGVNKTDINTLKNKIETLTTKITNLQTSINNLNTKINNGFVRKNPGENKLHVYVNEATRTCFMALRGINYSYIKSNSGKNIIIVENRGPYKPKSVTYGGVARTDSALFIDTNGNIKLRCVNNTSQKMEIYGSVMFIY